MFGPWFLIVVVQTALQSSKDQFWPITFMSLINERWHLFFLGTFCHPAQPYLSLHNY